MVTSVDIPSTAESVSEVVLVEWLKKDGDWVETDEAICVLETDKADVELPSPATGVLKILKQTGETILVGETVAQIDESQQRAQPAAQGTPPPKKEEAKTEVKAVPSEYDKPATVMAGGGASEQLDEELSPAVKRLVTEHNLNPKEIRGTGKGGRLLKEDVINYIEDRREKQKQEAREAEEREREERVRPMQSREEEPARKPARTEDQVFYARDHAPKLEDGVKRVPMSKIRKRIADHLVMSQQTAAMLTTFNEIDMSAVLKLRDKYRERFDQVHGVRLGLMSFFARACVLALNEFPSLNASVEEDDIIYHPNVDLGIAVSTERGLVVPVLRKVEVMSFAKIELEIKRLAAAARNGRLGIHEISGGTFTITNGGVFGSLLSTPILNLPQSGILGMHAIKKRPVVVEDQIEIRPMMYVALTYDHRIVDGNVSVSFLVRVKECLEDPARLMLEI